MERKVEETKYYACLDRMASGISKEQIISEGIASNYTCHIMDMLIMNKSKYPIKELQAEYARRIFSDESLNPKIISVSIKSTYGKSISNSYVSIAVFLYCHNNRKVSRRINSYLAINGVLSTYQKKKLEMEEKKKQEEEKKNGTRNTIIKMYKEKSSIGKISKKLSISKKGNNKDIIRQQVIEHCS